MEKQVKVEEWLVEGEKRQVYGKLYMPAQAGRYPAIILSHGYNGSHRDWEKECQYCFIDDLDEKAFEGFTEKERQETYDYLARLQKNLDKIR